MYLDYIIPIIIGYLLGSISPAYILGRVLKGIDIRQHGTKNAGTRNVKKVLGLWPAVVTAIFDLSKGLLAMFIVWKLGASEVIIYSAGYAAVLGHIFPFYLKFRGGEGAATGTAILIFLIIKAILNHWFPYEILIPLAILALIILFITKTSEIVGLFTLPTFALLLLSTTNINPTIFLIGVILMQLFIFTLFNIKKLKLFTLKESKGQIMHWRTLLRPLAALFSVFGFIMDREIILYLAGTLALIFIILDLIRLLHGRVNVFLFNKMTGLLKEKERVRFSSMTFFLSAIFILFLVFPMAIAQTAVMFLVFGDLAAKFFGLLYGRRHFLTKSLEGFLAYFAFSFITGYMIILNVGLPVWILGLGALTASFVESLSIFGIDDNFTVGLISASLMYALVVLV